MSRRNLGLALLLMTTLAVGVYAKKQKPTSPADDQKRALHAIDRLTFGPRPGDVQAVEAIGVDKWMDLQLHPERIDNSAMQARLANYLTLTMPTREMVIAFPPNPIAKQAMDGKLPIPSDPYKHAIYVAAMDRVEQKQEQKQNAADNTATPNAGVQPADLTQKQAARQQAHSAVDDLILLEPAARMQRILTMPDRKSVV